MERSEEKLYCPKCGSSQLTANRKGYGVGKAAAGVILTGGVGLLAGFIGSDNVKITCLKCGNVCKPGELCSAPRSHYSPTTYSYTDTLKKQESKDMPFGCFLVFVIVLIIWFAYLLF